MRALLQRLASTDKPGDDGSCIDALRAMGMVHAWRGRHAQASLQPLLALADASAIGDQSSIAILLRALAAGYYEVGQYAAALTLLQRLAQMSEESIGEVARMRRLQLRSRTLLGLERHTEAAELAGSVVVAALPTFLW